MLHYQIVLSTVHKISKTSYKNNKLKLSGSTWDQKFELLHGIYFM